MDAILKYNKCDCDDFYKLLGCDETSTTQQILAEYKNISLHCHPDKNLEDENAVIKFQKIQKAKEYLTDPEKRSLYDKWRRCGFSMPFDQFLNLNKTSHTSMHWATKKQKDLMIENCQVTNQDSCSQEYEFSSSSICRNASWERDPCNEALRKFRNYEI